MILHRKASFFFPLRKQKHSVVSRSILFSFISFFLISRENKAGWDTVVKIRCTFIWCYFIYLLHMRLDIPFRFLRATYSTWPSLLTERSHDFTVTPFPPSFYWAFTWLYRHPLPPSFYWAFTWLYRHSLPPFFLLSVHVTHFSLVFNAMARDLFSLYKWATQPPHFMLQSKRASKQARKKSSECVSRLMADKISPEAVEIL